MTTTRPDIAYSLGVCARFMSNPSIEHFKALDRIWQYLNGTKTLGLYYKATTKPLLLGYSDSNWGGDYNTRRSTTR